MAASLLALALTVTTAGGNGTEGDAWLALDRELGELASAYTTEDATFHLGGRLRTSYASGDENFTTSGDTLSGVTLRNARIELSGDVAGYDVTLSTETQLGGPFGLTDAFVSGDLTDSLRWTFGRYKEPFLYTGRLSSKRLLFLDRAITGGENDSRDLGARLDADWGKFHWILSLQNGTDGPTSDILWVGQVSYIVLGNPFDSYEGSYGQGEGLNLGFGFSASDDGAIDNGMKVAGEAELSQGPFYLQGDVISYDQDYDRTTGLDPDEFTGLLKTNSNPASVTAGYLLEDMGSSTYEFAVRFDRFDDSNDSDRLTVGLNLYPQELGHYAKWHLSYTEFGSDDPTFEGNRIELGLALAW